MIMVTILNWILLSANVACLAGGLTMVWIFVREVGRWHRLNQALWILLTTSYGLRHNPRAMLLLACMLHRSYDAVRAMLCRVDTGSEC
jgi:hypothetical protein